MNIAGPALESAQEDRVQQFDGGTLIFRGMIDRENLVATLVFFDEDGSVLRFEFSERLTGALTPLESRQDGALGAHHLGERFADQKFQFIQT
jgi:hypothetical protein